MTIKEIQETGIQHLTKTRIPSAQLDAEVLLSYVLNKPKEFLYTNPKHLVKKQQQKQFNKLIQKRAKRVPIAYLTNSKEFYGLDFYVNKDVLIPRPETELIVDEIKSIDPRASSGHHLPSANERKRSKLRGINPFDVCDARKCESFAFPLHSLSSTIKSLKPINETIVDIGTGSGCIAVTLKKIIPTTNIIASDISGRALRVARKNARKHNTEIKFIKSDLLNKLKNKKIDILIANLPYLPPEEKVKREKISPEIKKEPKVALWTKESGLKLYRKLFKQIKNLKYKPKTIICEIDHDQTKEIIKLANNILLNYKPSIIKDLAEKDRVIKLVNAK